MSNARIDSCFYDHYDRPDFNTSVAICPCPKTDFDEPCERYFIVLKSLHLYFHTSGVNIIHKCHVRDKINMTATEMLARMDIVYGREDNGTRACTGGQPTTHFPEYFTYSMLLVLISCAVYQMMISALKAVYLLVLSAAYLFIVHFKVFNLFDNQDFLLQTHDL